MFNLQEMTLTTGDLLIIHFNRDIDYNQMQEICKYLQQFLPENEILAANDYYINGMTVIHAKPEESVWGEIKL